MIQLVVLRQKLAEAVRVPGDDLVALLVPVVEYKSIP
jgi:hypothetical protein